MSTKAEILNEVAAGTLSPQEAAARLDSLEAQSAEPGTKITVVDEPLQKVDIHCQAGSVLVIGDPTVREAVAEGEHVARREGDTLVIELAAFGDANDSSFWYSRKGWGAWSPWGFVRQPNQVRVRVRPDLAVAAEVQAGSISVRNTTGHFQAKVSAGSCSLDEFHGTFDVQVQAGSLKASAVLDHGDSRVDCEAGAAKVNLLSGSSVRISARSSLGTVSLPAGDGKTAGWRGSDSEAVVGAGTANLRIESRMGSVKVSAGE